MTDSAATVDSINFIVDTRPHSISSAADAAAAMMTQSKHDSSLNDTWENNTTQILPTLLSDVSSNITTDAPSPEQMATNPDEECKVFVFIIYVVILGAMCTFGLIGNTLSFLVLEWEKRSHVATFLLRVLALVDNFYLLTTGSSSIFSAMMLFLGHTDNVVQPYIMVLVWPLVYIAQMATVWMTLLIAFNRYVAICRPFQAQMLCTMNKTRIQLACLGAFILLYNIPRFCEYEIVTETINNETFSYGSETALKTNKYYNIIYENILYCLFIFLGPLLVLIFFNTCLIRELIAVRQRMIKRNLPVSADEEENSLTLVMIVIILVFLFCQTPAFLNQMLSLMSLPYECGKAYFYFYQISNLVASGNSCLNFVVYCVFRKQFRQRLSAFCLCGRKPGQSLGYSNAYNDNGETVTMYVSDEQKHSLSKPNGNTV